MTSHVSPLIDDEYQREGEKTNSKITYMKVSLGVGFVLAGGAVFFKDQIYSQNA